MRYHKFIFIWGLLFALALLGASLETLSHYGFRDLNAVAEFLMPGVVGVGAFVIAIAYFRSFLPFSGTGEIVRGFDFKSEKLRGRKRFTGCYKCKRPLESHTGSDCRYCRMIRCQCGACGCGRGALV